jgi:F0F1-type ATP synthase delta subunit
MKNYNKAMLHEAVSEFIQLHAFDHLLDNELAQLKNLLKTLAQTDDANQLHEITSRLKPLLSKANFFVETVSPAAIQLWFYALSYNNIPIGDMMQDFSISNELLS